MTSTISHNNDGWFDWAYKGVDHTLPGNGGIECRDFLSFSQRCWESLGASVAAFVALAVAYPRLRLPCQCPCVHRHKPEPLGKRLLLLLMCLTFGIELGFKFATRQMIWIGNPCHLATMLQIFILAAPPSRIVTAAFRLHLHMLTGAPIAILFPVINTRLLPFETSVYFLQHFLMLVIPFYLMHIGDPYIPEQLGDFSWAMVSFGILFLYHFIPLQLLAYVSHVNLNNMLCPAVSDPFHGRYYRIFAMFHQLILIPSLGKLLVILARALNILPSNSPPDDCHLSCSWSNGARCCDDCICSSNTTTESSWQEMRESTDVDSGVIGNSSGCNFKRCCDLSAPRTSHPFPQMRHYQHYCDHQYNCSCSNNDFKDVGSVMHVVNGKIIKDGPKKEAEKETVLRKREPFDSDAGQHNCVQAQHQSVESKYPCHHIEPKSSQDELNKPLHGSNQNESKNGHTKTF